MFDNYKGVSIALFLRQTYIFVTVSKSLSLTRRVITKSNDQHDQQKMLNQL